MKEGDIFISVNKNYVATTGYSLRELMFDEPQLYFENTSGDESENNLVDEKKNVLAHIKMLKNDAHYHGSFQMLRKNGR